MSGDINVQKRGSVKARYLIGRKETKFWSVEFRRISSLDLGDKNTWQQGYAKGGFPILVRHRCIYA